MVCSYNVFCMRAWGRGREESGRQGETARACSRSLESLLIMALISSWGPHSPNPNYLLKTPSSNTITLRIWASTYGFGTDTNIQSIITPKSFYKTKITLIPKLDIFQFQFSCSVVSDSLRPHESQHARPPCPPPTPGVYSNSCPSSWWCHPAISSSVVPFSSCPQSLPASGSFPMSQLFASGGRTIDSKKYAKKYSKKIKSDIVFKKIIHSDQVEFFQKCKIGLSFKGFFSVTQ